MSARAPSVCRQWLAPTRRRYPVGFQFNSGHGQRHASTRRIPGEGISKRGADREMKAMSAPSASESTKGQAVGFDMHMPGTFVALPLSLAWKQSPAPKDFVIYQFERVKSKFYDLLARWAVKLNSMQTWTTWPRYKIQRSKIVPTAKALHLHMSEALASGDLKTLQQICVPNLYNRLSETISRRKPGERVVWELVDYGETARFPRLSAHRVFSVKEKEWDQQATVGIASTQRLSRYTRTGEQIPGSSKLQSLTEYVVITRKINGKTWEPGPWRVWGSREPTTLGQWRKETAMLKSLNETYSEQQIKRQQFKK